MKTDYFSVLLQKFFSDYLISQRQASGHTISSYRDTFCLFLKFTQKYLKKEPSKIKIENITVDLIKEFLKDLEKTEILALEVEIKDSRPFTLVSDMPPFFILREATQYSKY